MYTQKVITHAAAHGIDADELPMIVDGCSGGVSWAYSIMDKNISCEECCHIHDIDYQIGGTAADRAAADKRLRICASGRGGWRVARAWVMWTAVRIFGKSYWAK